MSFYNLVIYLYKIARATGLLLFDPLSIRYIIQFYKSLLPGHNALIDSRPWLVFKAIYWLNNYLGPNMHVFEYGSGGSTIFFSGRVKKVVSVEHDCNWYKEVSSVLNKKNILNCEYYLFAPERITGEAPEYSDKSYTSTAIKGFSFEKYVKSIEKYPDKSFDLVSIDGRARVPCVSHAIKKVRPGGYLLLDNADRKIYRQALLLLSGHKETRFSGIGPYNLHCWRTSIWKII